MKHMRDEKVIKKADVGYIRIGHPLIGACACWQRQTDKTRERHPIANQGGQEGSQITLSMSAWRLVRKRSSSAWCATPSSNGLRCFFSHHAKVLPELHPLTRRFNDDEVYHESWRRPPDSEVAPRFNPCGLMTPFQPKLRVL